jgi:toxin secretion/phage lysis holin
MVYQQQEVFCIWNKYVVRAIGDNMNEFLITNKLIFLVFGLICLDVFTGILKATKRHTLKSAIMTKGLYKKYLIMLIIVMCSTIDKIYFGKDVLYMMTCTWAIFNEAISITENVGKLGVPLPKKLKNILEEFRNDKD